MATPYRGRFAPSPTGDLHLGSAATALVAWLAARQAGGSFVLRVEDVDAPRVVPGQEARQLDDLRWLGIDWDEGPDVGGPRGPYHQSQRSEDHANAIAALAERGLVYPCDCSRAEIARVASAPHPGGEGPLYPGTCREADPRRPMRRPPALRLRVPPGVVRVLDRWQGEVSQDLVAEVGDFVLRRGDGVFAYQLAVVVDDIAMGIGEVVRGADLLSSAPRQAMLARLLGATAPSFAHAPLVLGADGGRLAKRSRSVPLREWRDAGRGSAEVIALLARLLDLLPVDPGGPIAARDLVALADLDRLAGRGSVRLPPGITGA